jgi:hypothetical protein
MPKNVRVEYSVGNKRDVDFALFSHLWPHDSNSWDVWMVGWLVKQWKGD